MNIVSPHLYIQMFWMTDITSISGVVFQVLTSLNNLISSILSSSVTYYQKTLSRIYLCIFIRELKFHTFKRASQRRGTDRKHRNRVQRGPKIKRNMLLCFINFQMPQKNTKQYKQVKFYFKVLCQVEDLPPRSSDVYNFGGGLH